MYLGPVSRVYMRFAETAYKDRKVCATGSTFNSLRSLGVGAVRVRGLLEQKLKTILFVESAGENLLANLLPTLH